ncbi:hypothetical protein LOC51_00500 [Rubrivivax sp. JA1024]|nr:hypothetical protein [Rubrivivax sp. JA1024]
MATIRPKDEPSVTSPAAGDKLLLDGATVRSILVTDFLSTTQPLDATLTALASLDSAAGLLVETGADSFVKRTLTGTANEIAVANGTGAGGNPTLSLPSSLVLIGKTVTGGSFAGPAISSPTGIVKGDVGLGNVDNTSDATKNAAAAVLTNKTISASNNTISNLTTAMFAAGVVDNDGALAANSSTRIPTQAAVKAYADQLIAANDAMVFKGVLDCSTNPNYPAADRGWTYKVSVAGKIGGALGPAVEIGDTVMCITDGTVSGTQAAVGAQWNIVQANLVGAVTGPASSTSGNLATFNGTGGTVIQDSGKALPTGAIVGTSDAQALTNKSVNGLTITATTGTLTIAAAKTLTASNSLTLTGTDGSSVAFGAGGTVAYTANKLSAFAATTSAELAGVMSDETGTGALVFANAPTLVNPVVGTQTVGDSSTKAASTAFVQNAVAAAVAGVASLGGQSGALTFDGGSMASTVMTLLRYDAAQSLTQAQKATARVNVAAAPIAAMAGNVINLNGGMEVSQDSGTSAVTLTATATLQTKYLVDGVMAAYRGSFVASGQQVTDAPPGFKSSVQVSVGTAQASLGANDELGLLLPVEGVRCAKLGFGAASANAIGIFFWVKSHRTGTYSASLRNSGKSRSYPFTFSVSAADTWEYKSMLIAGDQSGAWLTDTGVGLYLNICIAGGSARVGTGAAWAAGDYSGVTATTNGVAATSDVFQVTGVGSLPLIAGIGAADLPDSGQSPFLVRPFETEVQLCQRQLQIPFRGLANEHVALGMAFSTARLRAFFAIPEMRAAPVGSASAASDFCASDGTVSPVGTAISFASVTNRVIVSLDVSGGLTLGRPGTLFSLNTNAALKFDARLT